MILGRMGGGKNLPVRPYRLRAIGHACVVGKKIERKTHSITPVE
jgi:hypothetical protein